MATLSYSFHIGSSGKSSKGRTFGADNSYKTIKQTQNAFKHNLRAFESENRNKALNITLIGSNDPKIAFKELKKAYSDLFDDSVQEYNLKQKRADRKITDYLKKIEDDKKKEIVVETIIQIGDKEFWDTKTLKEKQKMTEIFENQIKLLQEKAPNYYIVNATIHYDEASPHMHIIGIPYGEGYKNGMYKQVAKNKVFNQESLEILQNQMREPILLQMQNLYGKNIELKSKSLGRNKDLMIDDYKKIKEDQNIYKQKLEKELTDELKEIKDTVKQYTETKKWYGINTIKNIDENKKIKRKGIFNSEKEIVLDKEDYEVMLTMAKDQSTQLNAWSNAYEKKEKELEDNEEILKLKEIKIEELNNTIMEYSYENINLKNKLDEKEIELYDSNRFIKLLKEYTIKFLGENISNFIFKHIENKIEIDDSYNSWERNKQDIKDLDEDISFFNKIVKIKDSIKDRFINTERPNLINRQEEILDRNEEIEL